MTNGISFIRCARNALLLVQCVILAHCLLSVSKVESSSIEKASGRIQIERLESEVEVRDVDALQQPKADGKPKVVVSNSEPENTFPELETDVKIPVDAEHKKEDYKNRAEQRANQSAKKSAVEPKKPKVKKLDKKMKKRDALEPKTESKPKDAEKSVEKKKEAKLSDKARKRKEMYQRVHDPVYGLIKSSFGGKDHLHSLSNLKRGMKTHKSSSKKKTALKRLLKGKKKLSSMDELLSLFKPDSTPKDVEHPVALEDQSLSAENPSKLGSKKPEPKPVPGRAETELMQKSPVQQAEGSRNPPRSIILWTAWRSGSTFLGDLLASADTTFYSYEPLFHFGTEIFDNIEDQRTRDALKLVEDLLSCDARRHPDFVQQMYELKFPLLTNKKFYKECLVAKKCEDEAFFSDVCAASDLHVLKIIRLSLRFASSILLDPRFKDLQIVYLARDPRPVMRSRRHPANSRWCSPHNSPCHDPRRACAVLDQDVGFALELQHQFPERFFFVRYEDLATAPMETVEQLWQRLGLPITPAFSEYLQLTTSGKKPKEQVNDVTRDSAQHAFAWREDIAWELVEEVQAACPAVIANFGWKLFENERDLRNLSFPINLS